MEPEKREVAIVVLFITAVVAAALFLARVILACEPPATGGSLRVPTSCQGFEYVASGDDADQFAILIEHGQPADLLLNQLQEGVME
jgi:hypothetical protein